MKIIKTAIVSLFVFNVICLPVSAAVIEISGKSTVDSYQDTEVYIKDNSELHLTSASPLSNSNVYLETIDSWLYLTNLRPSQVVDEWLRYVYVGSAPAVLNENVRVEIYRHGTVIIPHPKTFKPLEVFTERDFGGTSASYEINTYHNNLGDMSAAVRSFKLKKGYMVTLAVNQDGTGFSRVFIADQNDLEVSALQTELDQTVTFMRVFRWRWVSQKGWAGGGNNVNLVQATWFYGWNADYASTLDAEYSPMRHFRYWPGWEQINAHEYSTAVLGFNEPENASDHSNENPTTMSVDECISLWPNMLKSGLRVGSLATTDGRSDYLYEFIDKCDALNYRVDFVAVHFYRGGQTATQLYNWLKTIHERTKRPIWITEWNNGANWTSESWPTDATAQQTKQLNDMTSFFNMLDTVSFVERHAVYNNVEWKRYMVDGSNLTPAGTMMKNFKSKIAYNPAKEFVPLAWKYRSPQIKSTAINTARTLLRMNLADNENGALVTTCLVERKLGGTDYELIESVPVDGAGLPVLEYTIDPQKTGSYYYRLRYLTKAEEFTSYSDETGFVLTPAKSIQMDRVPIANEKWTTVFFGKQFSKAPVTLFGTHTYNNPVLLTWRSIVSAANQMTLKAYPWEYISAYKMTTPEYIPYLLLEEGSYDWEGLTAYAGKTTADGTWKTVTFPTAFEEIPAVFAFQTSNNSATATSIRIRNVSKDGFDILMQKETAQTYTVSSENISYLAVTTGEGKIDGRKVVVGRTLDKEVGTARGTSVTVNWSGALNNPLFFSFIQTTYDELGAVTRLTELNASSAKFFKQAERSSGAPSVEKETAAWMVIESEETNSSIDNQTFSKNGLSVYPNPAYDYLYFNNPDGNPVQVEIFSLIGNLQFSDYVSTDRISVKELPAGHYVIKVNGIVTKFIKK